jgi:hypothetical protein
MFCHLRQIGDVVTVVSAVVDCFFQTGAIRIGPSGIHPGEDMFMRFAPVDPVDQLSLPD